MAGLLIASLGLVAYVFVGYPAIVALWATIRPRPVAADPALRPTVSLLIFAFNEQDTIAEKLRNTAQLDYPAELLEVLVVADGSDDRTVAIAEAAGGCIVLHQPGREGKLAAIKRGVAASTGEILLFSDANNSYTANTIKEIVAPFADPEVGIVTGRKSIDDGSGRSLDRAEGVYWRYESKIKQWESAIGSVVGVAGEVLATRRSAFQAPAVGVLNEDFVQAMSTAAEGWRVVYAPEARSVERASATVDAEMVRRSRLVAGRYQALRLLLPRLLRRQPRLAWQMVSHKGLRPIVPWALLLAAVSNIVLAFEAPWARALLAVQALFYVTAVVGARDAVQQRKRVLTYLPYYFCKVNFASFQGLWKFVAGQQSAVWARVDRG